MAKKRRDAKSPDLEKYNRKDKNYLNLSLKGSVELKFELFFKGFRKIKHWFIRLVIGLILLFLYSEINFW